MDAVGGGCSGWSPTYSTTSTASTVGVGARYRVDSFLRARVHVTAECGDGWRGAWQGAGGATRIGRWHLSLRQSTASESLGSSRFASTRGGEEGERAGERAGVVRGKVSGDGGAASGDGSRGGEWERQGRELLAPAPLSARPLPCVRVCSSFRVPVAPLPHDHSLDSHFRHIPLQAHDCTPALDVWGLGGLSHSVAPVALGQLVSCFSFLPPQNH